MQLVDHLLVDRVADLGPVQEHHQPVLALVNQQRTEMLRVQTRRGARH
ncbi:hypothetical protein ACOM2C_09415 [Pseudarthrobacter sp. So.54]